MERTENSLSLIRSRENLQQEEYRRRRRERRRERRAARDGLWTERKTKSYKPTGISDGIMLRIIICILIGGIGSIVLNSSGEKTEKLRSGMDRFLTESISVEEIKEKIADIKENGNMLEKNDGVEIDNDYIEEMNKDEELYKNQKK